MKKIILGLFLMVFLYRCSKNNISPQKETVKTKTESTFSTSKQINLEKYHKHLFVLDKKEILCFKTFESYKQLIDSIDDVDIEKLEEYVSSLNFASFGKINSKSNEFQGDELLETILNKDKIVKIDKWLIKVDVSSETVTAIEYTITDAYQLLVEGIDKRIKRFSTGDDVIVLLENNLSPENKSCGGIGSGVYPCYSQPYLGQIIKTFSNGVVWRLNPFVRFFRAGIWFRLTSQYEVWRYPTANSSNHGQIVRNISGKGVTIEMLIRYPKMWRKRRPCRSNSIGTRNGGFHFSDSTYGQAKRTVYGGIRNLNGYYFFVQGRAKYSDGSVTVASPYGGRNINSPY